MKALSALLDEANAERGRSSSWRELTADTAPLFLARSASESDSKSGQPHVPIAKPSPNRRSNGLGGFHKGEGVAGRIRRV
jgi:hypothetical protein